MSTATIAASETAAETSRTPLPLRPDTFFGVCEAVGEDLGFNPNFLRIPFGALLLWNPVVTVGCYAALGVIVATTRWFFPAVSKADVSTESEAVELKAVATAEVREAEDERLAA